MSSIAGTALSWAFKAFLLLVLYFVFRIGRLLIKGYRYTSANFMSASVKDDPRYQERKLLDKALELPVARLYGPNTIWQPREGYCGAASLANVMRSVNPAHKVQFGPFPRPYVVQRLAELLTGLLQEEAVQFKRVEVLPLMQLDEFRQVMRRVNDPAYRFIANFYRLPLFFAKAPWYVRLRKVFSGHFSPVVAYLPDEDLVAILDVNQSYGTYLVPTERFWEAVQSKDVSSGKYRALIQVAL